jgi:hypothetical protein
MGKTLSIPVTYLFFALFTIAAIILFLFHQQLYFDSWSDENDNLYVSKAVADGFTLYGDIPSSRPPMAIFPVAVFIKMGLTPLGAGRTVVFLTIIVTGITLWFLGKKFWGDWAGLTASLLFLLGPAAAHRTTFTGIGLVSLWCLLTVGFILLKKPWWSGLFAAMAVTTGQHGAILVGAAFLLSILLLGRQFYRFVLPFLALTGIIFLFVYIFGGHDVFQYLVGQHLYHVDDTVKVTKGNLGRGMKIWALENLYLLLLIFISLGREIWGRGYQGTREFVDYIVRWPFLKYVRDPVWVILILAIGHLLVVFTMKGGITLYVYPVIPLLALIAGRGAVHLSEWQYAEEPKAEPKTGKKKKKRSRKKQVQKPAVPFLVVGLLWVGIVVLSLIGFKSASLNVGQRHFTRYSFWHHFRFIAQRQAYRPLVASQIAAYVGPKTDRNAQETVWGDSIIASLVAMKTDRRVAANLADFDPVWLQTGILSQEGIVDKIEKDHVTYLIFGNWHNATDNYLTNYLRHCYNPPKEFPRLSNSRVPRLYVFRHRDNRPCLP